MTDNRIYSEISDCEVAFLLYLLGCSLHKRKAPKEKIEEWSVRCGADHPEVTSNRIIGFARFHMTDALAAWALDDPKYKGLVDMARYRTVSFDLERKRILSILEQKGIWYLPLKGSVLNAFYPVAGLRQFSDNDILADPERMDDVSEIMAELGYEKMSEEIPNPYGAHIEYTRKPFFNFEIHYNLFAKNSSPTIYEYYQRIRERMIPDAQGSFGYHLSENDFYQMMAVHAYKHYKNAGTGLRTLLDFYVYVNAAGSKLQLDRVRENLQRLCPDGSLLLFERTMLSLSQKLLHNPDDVDEAIQALSEQETAFLHWMTASGSYGTERQQVHRFFSMEDSFHKISTFALLKYTLVRMFGPEYVNAFIRYRFSREYPYPVGIMIRIGYAFSHLPECAKKIHKIIYSR